MTISTTDTSTTVSSNGVVTDFTANFKVLDASHIVVYHVVGSTATLKALTTDYTVPTVGTATTTVKFNSAPATGSVIMFLSVPFTQLARYVNSDKFPASSHEDALDKLNMLIRQTRDRTNRWAIPVKQACLSTGLGEATGSYAYPSSFSGSMVAGRVYRVRVFGHGQVSGAYGYNVRLNATGGATGVVCGQAVCAQTTAVGTPATLTATVITDMSALSSASGFSQSPPTAGVPASFQLEANIRCTASGAIAVGFATTSPGNTAIIASGTTFELEELPGCSTIPALNP